MFIIFYFRVGCWLSLISPFAMSAKSINDSIISVVHFLYLFSLFIFSVVSLTWLCNVFVTCN